VNRTDRTADGSEGSRVRDRYILVRVDPPARGQIVAGRFVVEEVAGRGGMGVVLRAIDQHDGSLVALKLLQTAGSGDRERFTREGRLLASLEHPTIVRFIAHGVAPNGQRYLAMEWLEGESLGTYLKRARLSVSESLALIRQIGEGLSSAHARGVVHRDLKPSNIFLVGSELARAKILDFGVAKLHGDDEVLTMTGAAIGTPGYMSPEQARGERTVDARSDIFSLGALLYRCITGKRPFEGRDSLALLMRVILEDAPRLRDERPDAPAGLDALLARMMARRPEQRPADGSAILKELDTLGGGHEDGQPPESTAAITASEQRVLCVVVIGTRTSLVDDDAPTVVTRPSERHARIQRIADSFGGTIHRLVGGSLVVTFVESAALSDLAVRAARCAVAIREESAEHSIAVVTGRGELTNNLRMGDVLDRGSEQLELAREGEIRVDEITMGLIETRFESVRDQHGATLIAERRTDAAVRTLLGKTTPLVGRDRELLHLESYLAESITESVARAVLVTGAQGVGKSRLRYEFQRRVEVRAEPIEVWIAHGDPMSAGAPYAMIAPAVKRALGILDGEPLEIRRGKLRARVEHVARGAGWDEADLQRVTEFLGELVGASFGDTGSMPLRAARREPVLLADQIRRAFEDFVAATLTETPLLIVLDDLQWGDVPSVRLLDTTMRVLRDRPMMVLALARSEVHDLFPRLWADRGVQEIRLGELTPRASEKLIRLALGPVDGTIVHRILDRAEGNAFFLEELIRATAEGKGEELPSTLLAMLQTRLESLEQGARRVLRAGAVFGHVFHRGAVALLLGQDELLDEWLTTLVARELLAERPSQRFAGEREFVFRNAVVRDAAYAMLVDDDRALGHRVVVDWLEAAGETEAMVLADHAERGGLNDRALRHYHRAAEQALEANDYAAAIERAERAISRGAHGEERGALLMLQAESLRWRGQLELARSRGEEALALLRHGSRKWCQVAGEVALVSGRTGDSERLLAVSRALFTAVIGARPDPARLIAALRAVVQLFFDGHYGDAIAALQALERTAENVGEDDPAVAARLDQARVARAIANGDLAERRRMTANAMDCFRLAGDLRNACAQQANLAYADLLLGRNDLAADALLKALWSAERLGMSSVATVAKHNLGLALARLGRLEDALTFEQAAVDAVVAQGDRRIEGASRAFLAWIHLRAGDDAAAEREARAAVEVTEHAAPTQAHALGVLAEVLLHRGAVAEACDAARRARAIVDRLGRIEDGEALVYLMFAETLQANGDHDAARAAITDARARVETLAAGIADASLRAQFLEGVPENARILALSDAWRP